VAAIFCRIHGYGTCFRMWLVNKAIIIVLLLYVLLRTVCSEVLMRLRICAKKPNIFKTKHLTRHPWTIVEQQGVQLGCCYQVFIWLLACSISWSRCTFRHLLFDPTRKSYYIDQKQSRLVGIRWRGPKVWEGSRLQPENVSFGLIGSDSACSRIFLSSHTIE
jgi:hypothetical protein